MSNSKSQRSKDAERWGRYATTGDLNRDAAGVLDRIATLLAIEGESPFRVRAYRDAASQIRGMSENLADLWRERRLTSIPGVGPSIAGKLDEWLRLGRSEYLENLERSFPAGVERLLDVPGIGPVRARHLFEHLGISSPTELAAAARAHRLRSLRGFGPRLEESIAVESQRWAQRERRLLLGTAWPIANAIVDELRRDPAVRQASVAGSLRRMRETIGDIDLLASADVPSDATAAFTRLPQVREILAVGPTKSTVLVANDLQIDLRVVTSDSWGAALQHFTGSKQHNIALRDRAIARGLRLNEYGVFEDRSGRRLGGETEEDIYRAVNLDWIPPEIREDRGEIQAAERHLLPILIERSDLNGDLHVHSNWSDGSAPIDTMVRAARDAGLDYVAITDHSPGLTVAHGLTPERFQQRRREIDEANRKYAPMRVLNGAEVDIRPDGELDLADDTLAELDYVSVSVHSKFRMARDEMTQRIIRAMGNPYVRVLNHPTGRLIDRRAGYDVDLEAVLRAAASRGVAVEINSQPDRLDLDDVWARRAKDLGCSLVVDSDAHGPTDFANLFYGVAVARRGWLTRHNVLNTRRIEDLLAIIQRPRRQAAR